MKDLSASIRTGSRSERARELTLFAVAVCITVLSAIGAKRAGGIPALAAIDHPFTQQLTIEEPEVFPTIAASDARQSDVTPTISIIEQSLERIGYWTDEDGVEYYTPEPGHERYYKGRPIRPVRTVWMVVTAYSPDHRSCGKWADGFTASMRSVWTNGMELVAADTRILPMGSLISVPGYAEGRTVPVLDRGGAIKGARLDVLYATHNRARQWGVQRLPITIWEYADED